MDNAVAAKTRTDILAKIDDRNNMIVEGVKAFSEVGLQRSLARHQIDTITRRALEELGALLPRPEILVPVARAGVAMWQAADNHFQYPETAFAISRKTKGTTQVDVTVTAGLVGTRARDILMLDTVAATGDTVLAVAEALRAIAPNARIYALICYASPEAIHRIQEADSLHHLAVAVQSMGVDPFGWLLPKIGGDAGDKLFGCPHG